MIEQGGELARLRAIVGVLCNVLVEHDVVNRADLRGARCAPRCTRWIRSCCRCCGAPSRRRGRCCHRAPIRSSRRHVRARAQRRLHPLRAHRRRGAYESLTHASQGAGRATPAWEPPDLMSRARRHRHRRGLAGLRGGVAARRGAASTSRSSSRSRRRMSPAHTTPLLGRAGLLELAALRRRRRRRRACSRPSCGARARSSSTAPTRRACRRATRWPSIATRSRAA